MASIGNLFIPHEQGLTLTSKVAVVELDEDITLPLERAVNLIGGINDLNVVEKPVVVKVGVFLRALRRLRERWAAVTFTENLKETDAHAIAR